MHLPHVLMHTDLINISEIAFFTGTQTKHNIRYIYVLKFKQRMSFIYLCVCVIAYGGAIITPCSIPSTYIMLYTKYCWHQVIAARIQFTYIFHTMLLYMVYTYMRLILLNSKQNIEMWCDEYSEKTM